MQFVVCVDVSVLFGIALNKGCFVPHIPNTHSTRSMTELLEQAHSVNLQF